MYILVMKKDVGFSEKMVNNLPQLVINIKKY